MLPSTHLYICHFQMPRKDSLYISLAYKRLEGVNMSLCVSISLEELLAAPAGAAAARSRCMRVTMVLSLIEKLL